MSVPSSSNPGKKPVISAAAVNPAIRLINNVKTNARNWYNACSLPNLYFGNGNTLKNSS